MIEYEIILVFFSLSTDYTSDDEQFRLINLIFEIKLTLQLKLTTKFTLDEVMSPYLLTRV